MIYPQKEKKFQKNLLFRKRYLPLQPQNKSRSGAVVARWAHNPKVVSSSLASATKKKKAPDSGRFFYFP